MFMNDSHVYEYLQTIQKRKQTKSVHLAVTRTGITLKENVFDMHTKCIRTHLNLVLYSPQRYELIKK